MRFVISLLLCLFLSSTALSQQISSYKSVCLVRSEPTDDGCGGSGSGVFISPTRVLTAYHVVSRSIEGKQKIRIERNSKSYVCKVSKYDKSIDLALLEVPINNNDLFINLGKNEPKDGEKLIILGHPVGRWDVHMIKAPYLETVCLNCIRAEEDNVFEGESVAHYSIEFKVSTGMSGGPLVNSKGRIVGICVSRDETKGVSRSFSVSLPVVREFLLK